MDKPAGVTSHDVVAAVRRLLGESRVGHAGTLDPFATGLLIVLSGRATRLAQHVHDEPKIYEAELSFGTETTTEDPDGVVTVETERPTADALAAAIARHLGPQLQVPPAYSAKRIGGKRAYVLARSGEAVVLPAVPIVVHAIETLTRQEEQGLVQRASLRVTCAGGTYVRSLARDIGRAAGSSAHLTGLRRVAAGSFSVEGAATWDDIREGRARLSRPLTALAGYPRQTLTADEVARVVRGIDVEARVAGVFVALVAESAADGNEPLVALAERRPSEKGDRWQPRVVMHDPEKSAPASVEGGDL